MKIEFEWQKNEKKIINHAYELNINKTVYEFESTLDKVVISTKCNIEFFNANGKYILEIQPVIADKKSGHWAVCEDAIVTQEITCN